MAPARGAQQRHADGDVPRPLRGRRRALGVARACVTARRGRATFLRAAARPARRAVSRASTFRRAPRASRAPPRAAPPREDSALSGTFRSAVTSGDGTSAAASRMELGGARLRAIAPTCQSRALGVDSAGRTADLERRRSSTRFQSIRLSAIEPRRPQPILALARARVDVRASGSDTRTQSRPAFFAA
jgi:hypothetical protein